MNFVDEPASTGRKIVGVGDREGSFDLYGRARNLGRCCISKRMDVGQIQRGAHALTGDFNADARPQRRG
jgi:hypothetical protein